MAAPALISRLKHQKKTVDEFFENDRIRSGRYRKGGWTGKEVLIHLKDSETVCYDRIRRVISEENPILWFFEQDLWQKRLDYMKQDISLAKSVFDVTRDSVIEAVEMHLKSSAKKEGVHSRRGVMSLRELVNFLIWHTEHHLQQLRKIGKAKAS